jgi:hypothetical protein
LSTTVRLVDQADRPAGGVFESSTTGEVDVAKKPQVEELEELIERCAGVDVGQAEVVVCARVPDRQGRRCKLIESFGTTTPDLSSPIDATSAPLPGRIRSANLRIDPRRGAPDR